MTHDWMFWLKAILACILLGMIIGAIWGSIVVRFYPESIHKMLFWFTVLGIVAMFAFVYYLPNARLEVMVFSTTLLSSAILTYGRITKPIEETDRRLWTNEPWAEAEPKF